MIWFDGHETIYGTDVVLILRAGDADVLRWNSRGALY